MFLLPLAACLAPTLQAAHSLPAGAIEVGLGVEAPVSVSSAVVLTGTEDAAVDAAALRLPDPGDVAPEFHIGLGAGFELGIRGLPFLGATQVKYSLLDETRHHTPLSIALAGELAVDPYSDLRWLDPRAGLLLSSTILLGGDLALRPEVAAWYGRSGSAVEYPLPLSASDDGHTQTELRMEYTQMGVAVPVGLELPVRVGDEAIIPYLGLTAWFPVETTLVGAECDGCTVSVENVHTPFVGEAWLGVRVAPWFVPARSR